MPATVGTARQVYPPPRPAGYMTDAELVERAVPERGWLRDYIEWAYPCTECPKLFHLAAGIACLSAAVGRRAWLPLPPGRMYGNLFTAMIGAQGVVRKTTALLMADEVLSAAFPNVVYTGDATAEALTAKVLVDDAERLLLCDELKRILGGPEYAQPLKALLAELYNCPARLTRARMGTGSSDIERPTVGIFGASTESWLKAAVTSHDIGGGLLSRFLWFTSNGEGRVLAIPPLPDVQERNALVAGLVALRNGLENRSDALRQFDLRPVENVYTAFYAKLHAQAEKEDESVLGGFIVRLMSTHAPKLAMLYALADNPQATAIDERIFVHVEALAELLHRGLRRVITGLSETKEMAKLRHVLEIITKAGPRGILASPLLQKSGVYAAQLAPILDTLLQTGQVVVQEEPVRGGTSRRYMVAQYQAVDGVDTD